MEGNQLSVQEITIVLAMSGGSEVGGKFLFALVGDRLPFLKLYVAAISAAGGATTAGFLTLSTRLPYMVALSIGDLKSPTKKTKLQNMCK